MKTKKKTTQSMRSHTQTISGNEQGENKCECKYIIRENEYSTFGVCASCGSIKI